MSSRADKLVDVGGNPSLMPDSNLIPRVVCVVHSLLSGISGLLCASVGLVICDSSSVRRWVGDPDV